jgi:hypothetical protein
MTRQERQDAWAAIVQRWLDKSFPALAAHAREVAKGDKGVLVVKTSTQELARILEISDRPGSTTFVELTPTWLPAGEFLTIIRDHAEDGPASSERWRPVLETMNPDRDVALYLASDPAKDPEGYSFSRFLFTSSWPHEADVAPSL